MFITNLPVTPNAGLEIKPIFKEHQDNSGHIVLVIDSDERTIDFLRNFFINENCNVISAGCLNDVMEKCKDKKIGLVITEFLLGDHTCLEIMMLMRKIIPDLPVAIMSSNDELISEKDALNFSANYFFTKPPEEEKLRKILNNCFNQIELFS